MMMRKLILGLSIAAIISSCSSTKNINTTTVPKGNPNAVDIPAKKGEMTELELQNWPHADIYTDSVPGMSLDKAYKFVADKKATMVIVGVLDSGIDINHEDLKDNIWSNSDEIAGNGKDDDNNGYIDDIHGWNFLGGEGKATPEQLEVTRIYKKLHAKFEDQTEDQISDKDKKEYAYYLKVKNDFEKRIEKASKQLNQAKGNLEYTKKIKKYLIDSNNDAIKTLDKKDYTLADLNTLPEAERSPILMQILTNGGNVDEIIKQMTDEIDRIENTVIDYYSTQLNQHYNLDFDGRKETGDNAYDIKDVPYGNSFTIGSIEDEFHGTHVSGIILATRNNNLGMNGVAKNVKLLSVRTVPDGDEYDKDVALAIRYAVDNGAKVLNMSFGKSYSPNAEWVYDAIKYAASKDVLLVHAAGNDHKNIDKSDNFPTDAPDKLTEITDNVITVGAMSRHYNEDLLASFSNYGKLNVDIFAPGLEIYSTFPNNKYESSQGTSMAAPEVVGVAALVRSYYPQLSASQVKHILMNSGIKIDFEVKIPGGEGKTAKLSDLSVSGRVLNAYNALKMADQIVNGK